MPGSLQSPVRRAEEQALHQAEIPQFLETRHLVHESVECLSCFYRETDRLAAVVAWIHVTYSKPVSNQKRSMPMGAGARGIALDAGLA